MTGLEPNGTETMAWKKGKMTMNSSQNIWFRYTYSHARTKAPEKHTLTAVLPLEQNKQQSPTIEKRTTNGSHLHTHTHILWGLHGRKESSQYDQTHTTITENSWFSVSLFCLSYLDIVCTLFSKFCSAVQLDWYFYSFFFSLSLILFRHFAPPFSGGVFYCLMSAFMLFSWFLMASFCIDRMACTILYVCGIDGVCDMDIKLLL